ncbi:MAG: protein-glutamate O-methyltransferase [Desulfobacterales bacterium]|nr:protein-glutamate O-methyltransferase [Desulfobacterales bacterium]
MVYELRDIDFEKISRLLYELCGINLHEGKKELVKARLGKRLRGGNFRSFADYCRYVTTEEGIGELITMIDSLSTNLTSFFREESHFHRLRKVMPEMVKAAGNGRCVPNLRIWSAGCSTGEEPYSLAITLKEISKNRNCNLKILATDISTRTLSAAAAGVYPEEKVKNIPPLLLRKYFQIGQGRWDGYYRVKKDLKDSVEFMRFNLMETPSFNDLFDIIFCRNVMIYFDKKTQDGLVNRFYDCLKEKGYLFVGHSESLTGLTHQFKYIEPSVYRK